MAKKPQKKEKLVIKYHGGNNLCIKTKSRACIDFIAPKLGEFGEVINMNEIQGEARKKAEKESGIIAEFVLYLVNDMEDGSYHYHLIVDEMQYDTDEVAQYLKDSWSEHQAMIEDALENIEMPEQDDE